MGTLKMISQLTGSFDKVIISLKMYTNIIDDKIGLIYATTRNISFIVKIYVVCCFQNETTLWYDKKKVLGEFV